MNQRAKSVTSLTTLLALGLTLSCDASAGSDRRQQRTNLQIQTCVAEIRNQVSYAGASRVVHLVVKLNQRNLEELEIRIDTTVYGRSEDAIAGEFETWCVTDTLGGLVSFRIGR